MAGGSFRRAAAPGAAAAAGAPGGAPGGAPAEAPQRSRSSASFGRLPDPEQLAALTKDQLKAECRRRGQKASGNKVELLSRLGYFKVRGTLAASGEWCGAAAASAATVGHTAPDHAHRNGTPANHANSRARNNTSSGPLTPQMIEMETSLVLWRKPFLTSEYFLKEVAIQLQQGFRRSSLNSSWIPLSEQDFDINGTNLISQYKNAVSLLGAVLAVIVASHFIEGPHKPFMELALRMGLWWSWWVILGVLSSVGLGTGLHTFLLYLGPHIAKVTMAAYECNTLNFPEPPYPNEIICPSIQDATWEVSIWNIMSKVRVEAMLWGCGTALGELPPYFMARAARLSQNHSRNQPTPTLGEDKDDENHILNRAKIWIEQLVAKVGFLGILACASIPNPLFDLAGLTCGHFLVPFWTFFGATLIGKAIIKMHIQKMFVIIAFNESLIGRALYWVQEIPWMGPWMEAPLLEFLRGQKEALHRKDPSEPLPERGSFLAGLLEKLVLAMVAFFVVSIVNSLAQSYQKRSSARGRKGKRLRD